MSHKYRSKVIIILAMHRSGSSFFTSWLQSSGIHVGDLLLGKGPKNPKGHFEDLDFLNLHENILNKNSLNNENANPLKLIIDKTDFQEATKLIEKKSNKHSQFAWKDPRNCLFINVLWEAVLKDFYSIVLYRNFEDIIDSLASRYLYQKQNKKTSLLHKILPTKRQKKEKLKEHEISIHKLEEFCHMYINYSVEIIKYLKKHPDKSLVLNIENIITYQSEVFDYLTKNWNIDMLPFDIKKLYNAAIWGKSDSKRLSAIDPELLNECKSIDRQLKTYCTF